MEHGTAAEPSTRTSAQARRNLLATIHISPARAVESGGALDVAMATALLDQVVRLSGLDEEAGFETLARARLCVLAQEIEAAVQMGPGRRCCVEVEESGAVWLYQEAAGSVRLGVLDTDAVDAILRRLSDDLRGLWGADHEAPDHPALNAVHPEDLDELEPDVLQRRIALPATRLRSFGALKEVMVAMGAAYRRRGFDLPPGLDPSELLRRLRLRVGQGVELRRQVAWSSAETDRIVQYVGDVGGCRALNPFCGDGELARALRAAGADVVVVDGCRDHVTALHTDGFAAIQLDLMRSTPAVLGLFDVVVAALPQTCGSGTEQVKHMMSFAKPHGRVIAAMGGAWRTVGSRRNEEFRALLERRDARIIDLPGQQGRVLAVIEKHLASTPLYGSGELFGK